MLPPVCVHTLACGRAFPAPVPFQIDPFTFVQLLVQFSFSTFLYTQSFFVSFFRSQVTPRCLSCCQSTPLLFSLSTSCIKRYQLVESVDLTRHQTVWCLVCETCCRARSNPSFWKCIWGFAFASDAAPAYQKQVVLISLSLNLMVYTRTTCESERDLFKLRYKCGNFLFDLIMEEHFLMMWRIN